MNAKQAKKLRHAIGGKCTSMSYDTATYELVTNMHVSKGAYGFVRVKYDTLRGVYKRAKKSMKGDAQNKVQRSASECNTEALPECTLPSPCQQPRARKCAGPSTNIR